jgi:hypothetical protein
MNTAKNLVAPVRNATLQDLADMLNAQDAAKLDVNFPVVNLRMENGVARLAGLSVFEDALYLPTAIADGHIADKLGIPGAYLKKLRAERTDLYDANVNGWVHGLENVARPDGRSMTFRLFQGEPGTQGVLRAVLSDKYGIIDNLDVLVAALQGVKDAGITTEILSCDLTENKMMVKIAAPEIFVNAPELLNGYRSPFQGANLPEWARKKFGVDGNGVFAGLVLTNSETGGGAFTLVPRIGVLSCMNGMMRTKDAIRRVHIGTKWDEGEIQWTDEVYKRTLDLITAKTKVAVQNFLSEEYLTKTVDDISGKAATPVENAADAIQVVTKQVGFTDTQRDGILDHFIKGGQMTAGGIMQAVTSFAQELEDADVAFEMEAAATKVLELAAAL